jgi:hypothetical protein
MQMYNRKGIICFKVACFELSCAGEIEPFYRLVFTGFFMLWRLPKRTGAKHCLVLVENGICT